MGRVRGKQRQQLRSPFLLAIVAVALGALGFSQLHTPVSLVAFFATTTPTLTASATSTRGPTRTPLATYTYTPTRTNTPSPTNTATPTLTPSQTPTPSLTPTASETPTITPTPTLVVREARVPILMYHHVGDLPADADAVRKSLTVAQWQFEDQMKFLADNGYTTIHIADLVHHLQTGDPLPPKPIILTFDDGYDDAYTVAYPILKRMGFVGTFFIIGAPTDYGSPGYVRWNQILEMYNDGMEIGAHSLTHRYNLGTARQATQDNEIKSGHKLMVDHLPNWTPIFSYPSGSYNQYTLDLLQQLGYVAAVTTNQGAVQSSSKPLELRRIRIRGEWGITQFQYWFNYFSTNTPAAN